MNQKSPNPREDSVLMFKPSTRVIRFIESFRAPGIRAMANTLFGEVQASSLLSIVTRERASQIYVVADELDSLASNLGPSVPYLPKTGDFDRLSITLAYLRSCCEQAEEGVEFQLSAWDSAVRQQLRLLSKVDPVSAGLIRQVTRMGNEDDPELQGVEELRLRINLALDRMHRACPNLWQQIQSHLKTINALQH